MTNMDILNISNISEHKLQDKIRIYSLICKIDISDK